LIANPGVARATFPLVFHSCKDAVIVRYPPSVGATIPCQNVECDVPLITDKIAQTDVNYKPHVAGAFSTAVLRRLEELLPTNIRAPHGFLS
jgi:hypothetical protein